MKQLIRVSACLTTLLLFSSFAQASFVAYSGSSSGIVSADVDNQDTGHDSYFSGALSAPLGNGFNDQGSLSINNAAGTTGATAYYGSSASAYVYQDPTITQFSGTMYTYIDGTNDSLSTYSGSSHAQTDYYFTLDGSYNYDFFASLDAFQWNDDGNGPPLYFLLVNTDTSTDVINMAAWATSDMYTTFSSAGALDAGHYHLWMVSDIFGGTDQINPYPAVNTTYHFDLTPVPAPAAAWLFGSGLIGLVGVARRKKLV